jgi:uncharacterized Zn finger protein
MNLSNFDQHVDPTIMNRGYNYFLNDFVDRPQQTEQGIWRTKVYGTYPYHVEIHVNPENQDEIESWSCDCPYDHGPVCKHIVAALFAIGEDEKSEPAASDRKKAASPAQKRQKIFDKATRENLQEFIKECFEILDGFENHFLAYFAELLDEDSDQKYRTIINNYIKAAEGPDGYIDYSSAHILTQPLWDLNNKAEELLYSDDIRECLVLCQTLIEEVSEITIYMDQSTGGADDALYSAFNTLAGLIEKAPPIIKDELFEWCFNEFSKQKYANYGFQSNFLYLLPQFITSRDQEKQFFTLLEHQIALAEQSQYSNYRVTRLINTKIEYLQENNRDEEALHLLEDNIHFWEFRMKLVDRALNDSDFKQAKKLCKEGIKKAKEEDHRGNITRWKEKLYEIAELEEDIPTIRKLAKELFFNGYNMQWYSALKKTYPKDEWPDKCEELINHIRRPQAARRLWKRQYNG